MRTTSTWFETKLNRVLAEAGTKFIRAYHITTVDISHFDPKYIKDVGFHFAENEDSGTAYLVWDTNKIKIVKKQRVDIDDDTGEQIY